VQNAGSSVLVADDESVVRLLMREVLQDLRLR
jgi:CheY-like chemotaxis protein